MRQIAKELWVSQSFLSQIRIGKRPFPERLKEKLETVSADHLLISDKQIVANNVASQAGFEPATRCLEGSRSIH